MTSSQQTPSKSHFLVVLRPGREGFPANATPEEMKTVSEHFAYYQSLTRNGSALLVGRTDEAEPIGLALLWASSLAEAERLLREDPAVARGVMKGKVAPYGIALLNADALVASAAR